MLPKKIKYLFYFLEKKYFIITFLTFTFIFTVYFSSSEGIHSVLEYPHYFTSEALLNYGDIDMSHFHNDPHYFVWQDLYYKNGKTLSVRGFFFSFITIPIHITSRFLKFFYHLNNFPKDIANVTSFSYEVSIASLYSIFTVLGLLFIYMTIKEMTKSLFISQFTILIMAFGSYMWKYAPVLTRQGVNVFLLGVLFYYLWQLYNRGSTIKSNLVIFLCWSLSFGIDPILFIMFSCIVLAYIGYLLYLKIKGKIDAQIIKTLYKSIIIALPIPLIIISINILLNLYWYGTFYYTQNDKMPVFINIVGEQKWKTVLFSTPFYPTIFYILFAFGKLPESVFSNWNNLPNDLLVVNSVKFAKMYNFFGLFSISPFLLFSFYILFLKKIKPKFKTLFFYSFLAFFIGICISTKIYGFWGGPQYDVRYFYPYISVLAIPLGLVLHHIFFEIKNLFIKFASILLFIALALYSLFAGWIGVISMLKPAQTGERRIWVDLLTARYELPHHALSELLNSTFMNRENAWIAVIISILVYIFILTTSRIVKTMDHQKKL